MPCYITKPKPPSKLDFDFHKSIGYLGTWEQYVVMKTKSASSKIFMCGDLGPHCADCMDVGDYLCDFPVGDGKTCDRPMCDDHAHEVGTDIHYCNTHYQMWVDFKNAGGVDKALKNVIAFKSKK